MAALILTPNLPDAESLDLLDHPVIHVAQGPESLQIPVPAFDETYAESSDTEGGLRVRSRPQNAVGGGKVLFSSDEGQSFWEAIEEFQTIIAALNAHGGTVAYEPPDGTSVTYEVEGAAITEMPQDGVLLGKHYAESSWTFTARPYGLLDPQTITATPVTSTDPLLELLVPNVLGSVDARGRLILTDLEGQDRSHVVWGLDTNYDPAAPTPVLLAADDAAFTVTSDEFDASFAGTAATVGGEATLRATLSTTPLVVCGSGSQQHVGTWRHLVRMYGTGTGTIWVRLVYKLGSSPRFSEGDWKELPGLAAFWEVDLGLMKISEAVQGDRTCEWRIEAYSEIADDTLAIHFDQLIPQPGGKARTELSVGTPTGSAGPNSPDVGADDSGIGSVAWVNPGNVISSNDTRATATLPEGVSHYLKVTDFDFAIPTAAVVTGIVVEIERSSADNVFGYGPWDQSIRLVKAGTVVGSNHAGHGRTWPAVDDYHSYGAPTDTWGATWVGTDINATTFGVAISATYTEAGGSAEARVDHVRISVYYTVAPDEADRVLHANQTMEIRSDAVIRETPSTEWGRLPTEGSYLKIPPAGRENRTHRLVTRARRNDVDSLADDVVDDELGASLEVTPRVQLLA